MHAETASPSITMVSITLLMIDPSTTLYNATTPLAGLMLEAHENHCGEMHDTAIIADAEGWLLGWARSRRVAAV